MNIDYTIRSFEKGSYTIIRDSFYYWLILEGSGFFHTADNDYSLCTHAMMELPAGEDAVLEVTEDTGMVVGLFKLQDFYVFQTSIRLLPPAHTEYIRKLFFLAIEMKGAMLPRSTAIHNAIDHLVFEVITSSSIIVNTVNPAIYHAIDEITKNYRKSDYDFTELITESGYSPNHFRKLFKDTTGITPLTFLNILRIDYAKGLIRRNGKDISMKDVALKAGFEDQYYFSRLFKKYENMSPSEYLQSMGN